MKIKNILTKSLLFALCPFVSNAIEYRNNNWLFELDADGMIGFLTPKAEKAILIDDWDVKARILHNLNTTQRVGLTYSIDAACVDDDEYIHDAFLLFEDKNYGRVEFGLTNSIARKMGLGVPDVGHLRINNKSILYNKLNLKSVLISDTTATTGHEALRLNLATTPTQYGQYGLSVSGLNDDYDYAIDMAFKIKQSSGKLKRAYSIALSYMDDPKDYSENTYSPSVTANWRGQMALGANLQYNSWIFGVSGRLIYDDKPIGLTTDGLVVGTGITYDLLQTSVSVTYLFSDTNLWNHHDEMGNKYNGLGYVHTTYASFRYKYSEGTSLFMSGGFMDTTPFFAVGIKSGF